MPSREKSKLSIERTTFRYWSGTEAKAENSRSRVSAVGITVITVTQLCF